MEWDGYAQVSAEQVHAIDRIKPRCTAFAHTHNQAAHQAMCMHNSTHKPGESPKWCQVKLSTRESKRASYITFLSQTLAHSSADILVSHQQTRTLRTGRTHSQNFIQEQLKQRTVSCWEVNHGVDQAQATRRSRASQESSTEAKPLHQHTIF